MKIKGLFIITIILASAMGYSFAFDMQPNNDTQVVYTNGVLATTLNLEMDNSKTGAFLKDAYDSNPCDNPVTVYNFTVANNKNVLEILNNNLQGNDSKLDEIEIIGFKFTPINSEYFNVTVDENNVVKVTKIQDVGDNEQVIFLSTKLLVRNKTTDSIIEIPLINHIADNHPNVQDTNKKLINQQPDIQPMGWGCAALCSVISTLAGAAAVAACEAICGELGVTAIFCWMLGSSTAGTAGYICTTEICPRLGI
jgi:hypothetical protein